MMTMNGILDEAHDSDGARDICMECKQKLELPGAGQASGWWNYPSSWLKVR